MSMYFKNHTKKKPFLYAHSQRQRPLRKSLDISHQPSSSSKLLQQAKIAYYQEQQYPKAIQLFEQYLMINPKSNEALYLCGVAYLHIRRTQQAIQKLKHVTKEYQNYGNALLLAAISFNKLGLMSKSFQYLDFCLNNYPQFEEALCFRGRLHMHNKCFTQAEMDFRTATGLHSATFLSFMALGDCMRSTNRFEKAIHLYQTAQNKLKSSHLKPSSSVFYELQLKIGICLYYLEQFEKSLKKLSVLRQIESTKGSELYYYIGLCQCKLENPIKAQLNFEYSLKLQTNKELSQKAYKRLLRLYLQHYQFYEANDLVDLAEKCHISLHHWKTTVQAFMLVIKGHYQEALKQLQTIIPLLKEDKDSKIKVKKSINELGILHNPAKIKPSSSKRTNFFDSPLHKDKVCMRSKSGRRKSQHFSKSVSKAINKIGSVCNNKPTVRASEILRYKTEHFTSDIGKTASFKEKIQPPLQSFNSKQRQLLYPLVLKFKAYSQFFLDQYLQAMQTYELYQNYVKDMFGKDSDLHYNKLLCEGMLMTQEELADDALAKFSQSVEFHFQKYHQVPQQPILYKLSLLIKLAVFKMNQQQNTQQEDPQVANSSQILDSTLRMMENYHAAISENHLAYYFKAIIFILQDNFLKARQCLDKTLKLADECNWKYLYVKGVVEMTLGNYYDAIKQFSAGLILEIRPQLFLGRCISFFMLSQEQKDKIEDNDIRTLMKSVNISAELTKDKDRTDRFADWKNKNKGDLLIQNCFSDLQNYVEKSSCQTEISTWVTRILFATKSYSEALTSIVKIQNCSYQFLQMTECIQIYEGQYQSGGDVGLFIKQAFDGLFLDEQQQKKLLQEKTIKNYNSHEFQYLTKDYQKWLVILNLYIQQKYSLLLKYMQKQLFIVKDDETQLLLRYNLCIVYLLLGDFSKVHNIVKSLIKFEHKYNIGLIISKMLDFQYEQDQCLDELKQILGIGDHRLLSNFLPYQKVDVINPKQDKIKIYVRANIPFPKFPLPFLQLKIDKNFILNHLGPKIVDKKIQAPWIRRTNTNIIQFTEHLEEDNIDLVSSSSKLSSYRELEETS